MATSAIEDVAILTIGGVAILLLFRLGVFDSVSQKAEAVAMNSYDFVDQQTDPVNLATAAGVINLDDNETLAGLYQFLPDQLHSDPGGWLQSHGVF